MIGKLTIEANIPEKEFMEAMLNQQCSGIEISIGFLFYALGHSWHMDKFEYYARLLMSADIQSIKNVEGGQDERKR